MTKETANSQIRNAKNSEKGPAQNCRGNDNQSQKKQQTITNALANNHKRIRK